MIRRAIARWFIQGSDAPRSLAGWEGLTCNHRTPPLHREEKRTVRGARVAAARSPGGDIWSCRAIVVSLTIDWPIGSARAASHHCLLGRSGLGVPRRDCGAGSRCIGSGRHRGLTESAANGAGRGSGVRSRARHPPPRGVHGRAGTAGVRSERRKPLLSLPSALFDALRPLSELLGASVALGTNLDDLGIIARAAGRGGARRHRSLVDAGFTRRTAGCQSAPWSCDGGQTGCCLLDVSGSVWGCRDPGAATPHRGRGGGRSSAGLSDLSSPGARRRHSRQRRGACRRHRSRGDLPSSAGRRRARGRLPLRRPRPGGFSSGRPERVASAGGSTAA